MASSLRSLCTAFLHTVLATACADAQQQGTPREQSRRQSPPQTTQAAAATLRRLAPVGTSLQRGPRVDSTAINAAARCVVQRVVDGDTIVCEGNRRVRLLLIDTPELSQAPFGRQAMQTLQGLTPVGTVLRIETDVQFRDRYGRTLGYLWTTDNRLINEEMVGSGMAVVLVYPPNVKYVDLLRAASAEAKRKKVGLWATDAFACQPVDHRAGRC